MRLLKLNSVLLVGVFAITGCQKAKMTQVPASKPGSTRGIDPTNLHGGGDNGGGVTPPTGAGNGKVPPAANSRSRAVLTSGSVEGGGTQDTLKTATVTEPETKVETMPTVTVTAQDTLEVATVDNQEWRLKREAILTPPPKRADNVIPWYNSNKPYNSILKVCGTPERPCPDPDVVLYPAPPAPPPASPRIVYNNPLTPHTKALDILFVVDTSDSLDVILLQIAQQVGKFIENLPPQNDYNIAVMLAHSPDSPWGSKLFVMDSKDVAVLKSRDMKSINQVRDQLVRKISAVKLFRDKTDGQGELGMLGLQDSLTEAKNLKAIKDAGFFRDDAGLTVIFISDEQDVCFDYSLHPNIKPKYTPNIGRNNEVKRDWFEYESFNKYCKYSDGAPIVTSDTLIAALSRVKQDKPVILTGIIFLSEQAIHNKNFQDLYRLEHEVGYGYKEVIEKARGQAVELGDHNFGVQMAKLGLFSNIRLSFVNKFEITQSPGRVKKSSIEVRLVYPPASKKAPMLIGGNDIQWQSPFVIVSDQAIIKGFIPGTKVEISYKYIDNN